VADNTPLPKLSDKMSTNGNMVDMLGVTQKLQLRPDKMARIKKGAIDWAPHFSTSYTNHF